MEVRGEDLGRGGEVSGKLRGTIGLTKGDKKQGKINEESNLNRSPCHDSL